MKVEMTGAEDRQGPWKLAVCGFAGVGKTLFASTAREPLFVFFSENPRLKSIADRRIPHVKATNDFEGGAFAQEKLESLLIHLQLQDHRYDTLVIDTGDELFQQMKAARTFQNGGEFGPGDWGWLADTYREVIGGLIDLPMNVIVLYHIKNVSNDEGTFRELMLQGAATDEAPSWFDIVGVLDTFAVDHDDGSEVTKRVLLTQNERMYPWLKDHSGVLPRRFMISDGFTDDFPRLLEMVTAVPDPAPKEVLDDIGVGPVEEVKTGAPVPTPEDLHVKKEENAAPLTETPPVLTEPQEPARQESEQDTGKEDAAPILSPEEETLTIPDQEQPELAAEPTELKDATEDATALAVEELGGEVVEEIPAEKKEEAEGPPKIACEECGVVIEDKDILDLARIRFRKSLCREHFMAELEKTKGKK